jgi:uncharacterized protein YbbC (DUF1343 family)
MLTGLDVLLMDTTRLKGRRVGLLSNSAGITWDVRCNVDALHEAGVNLVALFSPEHGFGGAVVAGEVVTSSVDRLTGLPIHSLYGETKKPTSEMLSGLDVLLFDLQDVGVRFYTYTTTLAYALEACAENDVTLMVLDRPNPIAGQIIEGPVLEASHQSFIGHGAIPIRYAMTIGELAHHHAVETRHGASLQVVAMQGWTRDQWFDQTQLPWAAASPNMPHAHTALFYPGMGLAGEGANCSIGALTPLPFERIGAPWLDGDVLANKMNALALAGVRFRATHFVPAAKQYPYADDVCYGVQLHVIDRVVFRPVTVALHLMQVIRGLCPDQWVWNARHFDLLMGNGETRTQLDSGASVDDIVQSWLAGQQEFEARRQACLLYE